MLTSSLYGLPTPKIAGKVFGIGILFIVIFAVLDILGALFTGVGFGLSHYTFRSMVFLILIPSFLMICSSFLYAVVVGYYNGDSSDVDSLDNLYAFIEKAIEYNNNNRLTRGTNLLYRISWRGNYYQKYLIYELLYKNEFRTNNIKKANRYLAKSYYYYRKGIEGISSYDVSSVFEKYQNVSKEFCLEENCRETWSSYDSKWYKEDSKDYYFLFRGIRRLRINDVEGAFDDFRKSIDSIQEEKENYYFDSITNYSKGLIEENLLIPLFNKRLEKNNSYSAFSNIFTLKLKIEALDKTLEYALSYLENIQAISNRNEVFLKVIKILECEFKAPKIEIVSFFNKFLEKNISQEIYLQKAAYEDRNNLSEDAIKDYEYILKKYGNDKLVLLECARIYKVMDNFEKAKLYYNNIIDLYPPDENIIFERAKIRYKLGDKIGAISDYNKLINCDPTEPVYYNNRGVIKQEIGDIFGANRDFEIVEDLRRENQLQNDREEELNEIIRERSRTLEKQMEYEEKRSRQNRREKRTSDYKPSISNAGAAGLGMLAGTIYGVHKSYEKYKEKEKKREEKGKR